MFLSYWRAVLYKSRVKAALSLISLCLLYIKMINDFLVTADLHISMGRRDAFGGSSLKDGRLTGVILRVYKSKCFTLVWSLGWQMLTRPDLFNALISVNSSSLSEQSFKLQTCNSILPNTTFLKGVNGCNHNPSLHDATIGWLLVAPPTWSNPDIYSMDQFSTYSWSPEVDSSRLWRSPDILLVPPPGWFILMVHTEQFDGFPLNVMFPTK